MGRRLRLGHKYLLERKREGHDCIAAYVPQGKASNGASGTTTDIESNEQS